MDSIKTTARQAGMLYLLLAILAPFNEIYIPRAFFVAGDATATAHNLLAGELTFRIGVFSALIARIVFLWLGLTLYHLFRDVDRKQARLMVGLVAVAVTIGIVGLVDQIAPLILLHGTEFEAAFPPAQLNALAMSFLRLHRSSVPIAMIFWGLWLFPFGNLIIKSGYFPKLLGVLLIIGGVTYVALSFISIVLPAYRSTVSTIALPFYAVGELAMILWLLVKGAKVPLAAAQAAVGTVEVNSGSASRAAIRDLRVNRHSLPSAWLCVRCFANVPVAVSRTRPSFLLTV
jgi:hypothetical protein